MSLFNPICGDCGLKVVQGTDSFCSLSKLKINPDIDSCSKHIFQESMKNCEICGNIILEPGIVDLIDGIPHIICSNCASQMGFCNTCGNIKICKFEQDTSPTEKFVQKQIRQGNMIMMTTVKNPKRIEETCKKDCCCYDEKNGCVRETIHYCASWKTPY